MAKRMAKIKKRAKKKSRAKTTETLDLVDLWLHDGIDLENRRIDFAGGITEKNGTLLKRAVIQMLKIDSKAPIHVFVDTFGGEMYASIGIYDILTGCGCPIYTYAQSKVMSGGLIIYAAGEKRFSFPNTTFMAHSIHYDPGHGTIDVHEIDIRESRRLNNRMATIISTASNKSENWWKNKLRHKDTYLNYDEAVALGLVNVEN